MNRENGYAQIRAATDVAIKNGWDHARTEWKRQSLQIIFETSLEKDFFSANDITDKIKDLPVKTHDNRAIAGVIMAARKFGWIRKTGDVEISKAGHLSRVQIWESLIFGKKNMEEETEKINIPEKESNVLIKCPKCGGGMRRYQVPNESGKRPLFVIECIKCGKQI